MTNPPENTASTASTDLPRVRRAREITADEENWRSVPLFPDGSAPRYVTSRRDPVEPEPVGTYIAMVFRVTGYDPDCDGSLMARLEAVGADGERTGWEPNCLGLYPDSTWVLDGPDALDRIAGVR